MPNSPVVKRPRAGSMRRTTSMKALPPSPEHNSSAEIQKHRFCLEDNGSISGGLKCPVIILPSATFLHSCYLCKRRLNPTRDIYMYRGDAAFCSLECRQEQIVMDERKEKCMLEGRKMDNVVMVSTHNHNQPSAASQSHAHKVQATA